MNVHELKTWPEAFEGLVDGSKTFEARINDRGFEVGDILRLREWHPGDFTTDHAIAAHYTGREVVRVISCMLLPPGYGALQPGYCILGLHPTPLGAWS